MNTLGLCSCRDLDLPVAKQKSMRGPLLTTKRRQFPGIKPDCTARSNQFEHSFIAPRLCFVMGGGASISTNHWVHTDQQLCFDEAPE